MLSDILQPSHIECEFVYRYLTLHLVSGYVMSKISFPLGISNVQNTVLRSVFSHKTGASAHLPVAPTGQDPNPLFLVTDLLPLWGKEVS